LLLHKRELRWIKEKVAAGRWTVPVRIYTKNRKFKLEVGIGYKLKKYDKREKEKEKQVKRESEY
jgi:tmRNA-binding protein